MSVSIIIPVHNSEKYLDECILSVIKQLKPNDEVIIVENGSTDNSLVMCRRYAMKYENIHLLELDAVGVSIARNEGIKRAKSKWITFLDADDSLQENALRIPEEVLSEEPDIIIAGYSGKLVKQSADKCYKQIKPSLLALGVLQYAKYKKEIAKYAPIDNYNNWACWGKFYRRSFLIKNNIIFPDGIKLSEDTAFCFQAYIAARTIYTTKQIMYYYRENIESVTGRFQQDLMKNNMELVRMFEVYKKKTLLTQEMDTAIKAFYVRKVIECFYHCSDRRLVMDIEDARLLLKKMCLQPVIQSALKDTGYFHLIIGKKNRLKYGYALWKLKHGHFR